MTPARGSPVVVPTRTLWQVAAANLTNNMRKRSKKMSATYRTWGPQRKAFLEEMQYCCVCGQNATCVDEICRGPYRMTAFVKREAWLPTCGICNCGVLTDNKLYPRERKLALKALCDPLHYNVEVIRDIISPKPVESDEVVMWIIKEYALKFPQYA